MLTLTFITMFALPQDMSHAGRLTDTDCLANAGMGLLMARRTSRAGWVFTGPFLAVFAFALVAPIGYAIYLSLFRHQLIGGNTFVGLANYGQALADPKFWESFRRV